MFPIPLTSSMAQELLALRLDGLDASRTPVPSLSSWPKVSTSGGFLEPGFASRSTLGFLRMVIRNWKYSLLGCWAILKYFEELLLLV